MPPLFIKQLLRRSWEICKVRNKKLQNFGILFFFFFFWSVDVVNLHNRSGILGALSDLNESLHLQAYEFSALQLRGEIRKKLKGMLLSFTLFFFSLNRFLLLFRIVRL